MPILPRDSSPVGQGGTPASAYFKSSPGEPNAQPGLPLYQSCFYTQIPLCISEGSIKYHRLGNAGVWLLQQQHS